MLDPGGFIAFIAIFSQITRPVRTFIDQFANINQGIAAGERIFSIIDALNMLEGAFAFLIMTANRIYACRDKYGLRPLSIGKLGDGWVVSSETCAFDVLGAEFVPLYLGLMIQLALLMGCSLLCSLTGISRCRALFDCFAEAVRCMAAVVALFFGLVAAGVTLLFIVGGGS